MLGYLRELRIRFGDVDLGLVARRRVPLDTLYAEVPSSSSLSVEVRNSSPVRWAVSDDDPNAAELMNRALGESPPDSLAALAHGVYDKVQDSFAANMASARARPLILSPLWQDGIKPNAFRLSLTACIGIFPRIVITGPPGSGKSTLGRHVALALARQIKVPPEAPQEMDYSRFWKPVPSLPVFVELRPLVDFIERHGAGMNNVTAESLLQYIEAQYIPGASAEEKTELRHALYSGNAVMVFDGIDEVRLPSAPSGVERRRDQLIYFFDVVERGFSPSRIVLTSRDYAYAGWEIPGFTHVHMGLFGDDQIYDLARRLLVHVDRIGSTNLDSHVDELVARMHELVSAGLRQRPLFVSLMAGVYARRVVNGQPGLPTKPTDLYEESVTLLLDRWTKDSESSLLDRLGCTVQQLRDRLEVIAYLAHQAEAAAATDGGVAESGFSDAVLLRQLVILPGRVNYQEIVGYLNRETGLILSPAPGRYEFAHRTFQEYLAACHLFHLSPDSPEWESVATDASSSPIAWREVFCILGVLLVERGRADDLWRLIDSLLATESAPGDSAAEVQPWPIWLAATYIDELIAASAKLGRTNQLIVRDLLTAIETIQSSSTLPVLERSQLWNTRSRLRVLTGKALPPTSVEWCEIPAGGFRMGIGEQDADNVAGLQVRGTWVPKRETPDATIQLPAYRISRYAVTRRDFAEFLAAPEGYYSDDNWRTDHFPYRHHSLANIITDPNGQQFPDVPRTEVTWFDAIAYCEWLSKRLGYRITLPSEPQWEKAARGLDGRLFPWGDKFLPRNCNSQETDLGDLTPVGTFPPTNAFWGPGSPCDMVGNVWEWCTTICEAEAAERVFPYPYDPDDGRESYDPSLSLLRVVRGGCYVSPPHQLMTTFRGRDRPNMRQYRQGFRVAAGPEGDHVPH